MRIDLVYTWVDGEDPDHRRLRESYAGGGGDLNPERFRDNFSMLKYSLRSVHRHASWLGQIHIVAHRPQQPAWLRPDERVHMVYHDQIWDDPTRLPSFHSQAIESFLHRIPGLSEHFLYFNDDWLFFAPTRAEDLLGPRGEIKVMGTLASETLWDRLLNLRIQAGWVGHAPTLMHRAHWEASLHADPAYLEEVRSRRFRNPSQVGRLWRGYRAYLLGLPRDQRILVPAHRVVGLHRLHRIDNRYDFQVRELRAVERLRARFLCLNDDLGAHPDPRVVELLRSFLERHYPEKSPWEI